MTHEPYIGSISRESELEFQRLSFLAGRASVIGSALPLV